MNRSKLKNACEGQTAFTGGLSLKQLRALVKQQKPDWAVSKMSRRDLLDQLCNRICPAINYTGAEDIIADIDIIGNKFTYKGHPIDVSFKKLLEGMYGEVYRATFVSEGRTLYFAIKHNISDIVEQLSEVVVVAEHAASVQCPGIVSMKIKRLYGEPVVIMPLADGDLNDYVGLLNGKQADAIVKVVQQALLCMHENGDYYFDIKPDNILFHCDGNGLSTIYLGDMGSIIPYENCYASTFPPPDAHEGYICDTTDALKYYTYMLACLYCYLVSGMVPPNYSFSDDNNLYMFPQVKKLVAATEAKLKGRNKYTVVLNTVVRDKNLSRVPDLDEF